MCRMNGACGARLTGSAIMARRSEMHRGVDQTSRAVSGAVECRENWVARCWSLREAVSWPDCGWQLNENIDDRRDEQKVVERGRAAGLSGHETGGDMKGGGRNVRMVTCRQARGGTPGTVGVER